MGRKRKSAQQAGKQAIPADGAAVPAGAGVPAEKPADTLSGGQGESQAAGAGEHPATDPMAAVAQPAVAVGTEEAEGVNNGEAAAETLSQASQDANQLVAATMPQRFRKRTLVIEAIRADGSPESNRAIIDWTRGSETPASMDKNGDDMAQLSINTLEGALWITPGDYVVRGVKGEHYPVSPDIFHELYDPDGFYVFADPGLPDDDPDHPDLTEDYSSFGIAALAASCAAAARVFVLRGQAVSFEGMFTLDEAEIMVAFVRDNPEAPMLAMYKHLQLTKRLPSTVADDGDVLALKLFHAAASAAIAFEAARAALYRDDEPKPAAGVWPGERAFKPQDPAFSPTGFSPR